VSSSAIGVTTAPSCFAGMSAREAMRVPSNDRADLRDAVHSAAGAARRTRARATHVSARARRRPRSCRARAWAGA
jgi:hypothetical protein